MSLHGLIILLARALGMIPAYASPHKDVPGGPVQYHVCFGRADRGGDLVISHASECVVVML